MVWAGIFLEAKIDLVSIEAVGDGVNGEPSIGDMLRSYMLRCAGFVLADFALLNDNDCLHVTATVQQYLRALVFLP